MKARNSIVVLLQGPVAADAAAQVLCRLTTLLEQSAPGRGVTCRVAAPVDLSVVDSLVRMQVLVRRHGAQLFVQAAGSHLTELLRLTGLDDLLPPVSVEPAGPPEER